MEVCNEHGNCCETLIENSGTALQQGALDKLTGDQIGECAGKKFYTGDNIKIAVEKPGIDGWIGSFIA